MRLLHTSALELSDFQGKRIPDYSILSHTWDIEIGEVSYEDIHTPERQNSAGYTKIESACSLAVDYGLDWMWINTCCIDKKSSAELSEAINSMYSWYRKARLCFVYLADISAKILWTPE